MKCTVCDRCKTIIEDMRRSRVITCAKPLKPDAVGRPPYHGDDPKMNEILWTKELCSKCMDELDEFFEPVVSGDPSEDNEISSGSTIDEDDTQDVE